ncbi:hypothetical protein GNZ06_10065 [Aeromonas jandaei]|uniref:hypothetical protein n=1 Tax=Aeromonas jandaei TaxID=650 RepID=UPI0019348FD8|nr:hypothetical protein [Aeromonas jandaei]MBM0490504.1 hypothetical protein [Aeromonas jandaei]MBM0569141.1 hypothetical protein [Aeromonas jandaei]
MQFQYIPASGWFFRDEEGVIHPLIVWKISLAGMVSGLVSDPARPAGMEVGLNTRGCFVHETQLNAGF